MKKNPILISTLFIILFISENISCSEVKSSNNFGINTEIGVTYYRRGFGPTADITIPINLWKNLYIEPGIKMIGFTYSLTHFYPLVLQNWNLKYQGFYLGLKTDLKYRIQIIPNFGLITGCGIGFGPEFSNAYSFLLGADVQAINLELTPELSFGTYINYKNFRFDILIDKMFPIIVSYYHFYYNKWVSAFNYNEPDILNPLKVVCVSSMSLMFGITYFFKWDNK